MQSCASTNIAQSILKRQRVRRYEANSICSQNRYGKHAQTSTQATADKHTGNGRQAEPRVAQQRPTASQTAATGEQTAATGLGSRRLTLSAMAMRSFSCLHTQTTGGQLHRDLGSPSHRRNRDLTCHRDKRRRHQDKSTDRPRHDTSCMQRQATAGAQV